MKAVKGIWHMARKPFLSHEDLEAKLCFTKNIEACFECRELLPLERERGCAPAASGRGSVTGRATLFQTQTPCDHHRGNTSGKPRQCRPTGFSWKRPPNPRHPQPTCYHTADSQQEPANSQEPAISQNKTHTRTCILQHTQDTYEQITIHIQQAHATQTKH